MSHFYGTVDGGRSEATRQGHKKTGIVTNAASWSGAVRVSLYHNSDTGKDEYTVSLSPWRGKGVSRLIKNGNVDGSPLRAVRSYYDITRDDVGALGFNAWGRYRTFEFMGQVLPGDVGKRIYEHPKSGILQVENDEQRAKRLAS